MSLHRRQAEAPSGIYELAALLAIAEMAMFAVCDGLPC
jgi:hypothetical protein